LDNGKLVTLLVCESGMLTPVPMKKLNVHVSVFPKTNEISMHNNKEGN